MRLQNSNLNVAGSSSISSSSPGQSGTNIIPQKRLFSPNNSACTGVTHRPSVDLSACGSEFARSADDAIRHGEIFTGNYVLRNTETARNYFNFTYSKFTLKLVFVSNSFTMNCRLENRRFDKIEYIKYGSTKTKSDHVIPYNCEPAMVSSLARVIQYIRCVI